ncbi:hypothetical protein [Paenirhodobacter sp. CAU 1674]|uniref:hypothetical protein n=1 Tax=Paenirhodobacter sp. CAU 1674 TaxID=3032596 RepID=UPI0023DCE58D|nr:hypothetical protein [Paenirhodobacter sp. CAU 1674]MDF2142919.1 hypothetical protein [Paenirhodobacter sp. CAU 1674]
MKHKMMISLDGLALLSACKDDDAVTNELLSEALTRITAAARSDSQAAACEDLIAARDAIAAIRADLPGTEAARQIASGAQIGAVDLAQLNQLIARAELAAAVDHCAIGPTARGLMAALAEATAARRGESVQQTLEELPQDYRTYLALLDQGAAGAKAFAGQTRSLPDRDIFDLMYRLLTAGHEDAVQAWLEQIDPAPGSRISDWPAFMELVAEYRSGRNLVQTPVTMAMAARLARSQGAAADHLVTQLGGIEAFTVALGDRPAAKLAEWQGKGWIKDGSDAAAIAAVVLWRAGQTDAARALFGTRAMAENDFAIDSLPDWLPPEAQADLLRSAQQTPVAGRDLARILVALIGLGDKDALQTFAQDPTMAEHAARFAFNAGRAIGQANDQAWLDSVLGLPDAQFPEQAQLALQDGWMIERAIAGEVESLPQAIRQLPPEMGMRRLVQTMWHLVAADQPAAAEALFAQLLDVDVTGDQADPDGRLLDAALLAGQFEFATQAMTVLDNAFASPEQALRLRLAHAAPGDQAALMRFLAALDQRTNGRAAEMLAKIDRMSTGQPALAARYALSLTGSAREIALENLMQAWPGQTPNIR